MPSDPDHPADRADLAEVARLERRTLEPDLRARPRDLAALLHPDFAEHGKSGRVWHRDDVTAAVGAEPGLPGEVVDLEAVGLSADVVLVTYRITGPGGSLRSSVWVRDPAGAWSMRFHQGTASPSDPSGRGPDPAG